MGKKQHQKDKLYITCNEWSTLYGGKRATNPNSGEFKRLPFNCCSITFQPFTTPCCTSEGVIFDLENIVPFVKKHGINPVTGKKMRLNQLIRLHFHRNSDNKYHCPITFKVFNENTRISAVKVTGNVYSFDAIERLNIKSNNFTDLLTNEPFSKNDIITLQDPSHLDKFNISAFYHVRNKANKSAGSKDSSVIRSANQETRETLSELEKPIEIPSYMYSVNKTNAKLSGQKNRDSFNTIQGGDPSGTGMGGKSAWDVPFGDEFLPNLSHDSRGVVSMANSGPGTNQSQFFITFRVCKHLDRKHTIFGKIVGGLDTLGKVEMLETDKDDRPLEDIEIQSCTVFVDPFKEVDEMLAEERAKGKVDKEVEEANKKDRPIPGNRREEEAEEEREWSRKSNKVVQREGVGKFIDLTPSTSSIETNTPSSATNAPAIPHKRQKTVVRSTLSDFSSW